MCPLSISRRLFRFAVAVVAVEVVVVEADVEDEVLVEARKVIRSGYQSPSSAGLLRN
jgi:hypothetical protein